MGVEHWFKNSEWKHISDGDYISLYKMVEFLNENCTSCEKSDGKTLLRINEDEADEFNISQETLKEIYWKYREWLFNPYEEAYITYGSKFLNNNRLWIDVYTKNSNWWIRSFSVQISLRELFSLALGCAE